MQVFVVGSGKLAGELINKLSLTPPLSLRAWTGVPVDRARSIVVHAGSGKALDEVMAYCRETKSPLIELSTGSLLETLKPDFPVVLCPNTNILMLKFMHMLARSGALFSDCEIHLTESHQATKTSTPGTAVAMAKSLGLLPHEVVSVRDRARQLNEFGIPEAHLDRHAFHAITLDDGVCHIRLETRVEGAAPYAAGVSKIVSAVAAHPLDDRLYFIDEFIGLGWL